MNRFWRPLVATGLVAASMCPTIETTDAAGRLSERLPVSKATSPREPRERERLRDREKDKTASDETVSGTRLLGLRASGEGRLPSRSGKRKDAPAEAKAARESLDDLGDLKIELGDAVETLDDGAGAQAAPPSVPPTEDDAPRATRRQLDAPADPARDQAPRRTSLKRSEAAASTAAVPQQLQLLGPRSVR